MNNSKDHERTCILIFFITTWKKLKNESSDSAWLFTICRFVVRLFPAGRSHLRISAIIFQNAPTTDGVFIHSVMDIWQQINQPNGSFTRRPWFLCVPWKSGKAETESRYSRVCHPLRILILPADESEINASRIILENLFVSIWNGIGLLKSER